MLLNLWLDQPVWLIVASLSGLFLGAVALLCLLPQVPVLRPRVLRLGSGVVAPYFGSVSVLLALLIGFVANDAWERQRQATRIVNAERASLLAIHDLSLATISDMRAIRERLAAYADALIADEWPKMLDGESSARASAALGDLLRAVADPRVGVEGGAVAHAALLDAAMNLRAARGDRLALSETRGNQSKWITLLVLAGLTLAALWLVHMDKPWALATTLLLFTIGIVTTFSVIALNERPFDGVLALEPTAIVSARAAMAAGRAE